MQSLVCDEDFARGTCSINREKRMRRPRRVFNNIKMEAENGGLRQGGECPSRRVKSEDEWSYVDLQGGSADPVEKFCLRVGG